MLRNFKDSKRAKTLSGWLFDSEPNAWFGVPKCIAIFFQHSNARLFFNFRFKSFIISGLAFYNNKP